MASCGAGVGAPNCKGEGAMGQISSVAFRRWPELRWQRPLVVLIAAAVLLIAPRAPARADDGYTDISGRSLAMHVRFPDKDSGQMIEQPIPAGLLSPQAQQMLGTPLSTTFDQLWNGVRGQDGKTMRDQSCDRIQKIVSSNISSSDYQAYNISCSLSARGTLRAALSGKSLVLSYWIGGNDVSFNSTTPDTCSHGTFLCPTDPRLDLSFDGELLAIIGIPDTPCPLTFNAQALVHNANISADNWTASLGEVVKGVVNYVNDEPLALFQTQEGQVDGTQQTVSLAPIQSSLDELSKGCDSARALGFEQFEAIFDPNNGPLFRLDHALDAAPTVNDAATQSGGVPSLFRPTIGTDETEVKAGGQVTVLGTSFNAPETTEAHIQWNDTVSGAISESDVQWGLQGSQTQNVTLPRQPYDNGNSFDASNLSSGRTYQFRVRDCDQITCTPWGSKTITTSGQGSDQALFYLDSVSQANQIGTGTVKQDGSFSVPLNIPGTTTSGKHTLFAAVPGGAQQSSQQASADITVVGANQSLQPLIQLLDPVTNRPLQFTVQTYQFTLRGQGFVAGQVTIAVDSANGQALGTATAAADGTFSVQLAIPASVSPGNHTLVATEVANGQTLQATDSVMVQKLPQ